MSAKDQSKGRKKPDPRCKRSPMTPLGGRLYSMREVQNWAGVSYPTLYALVRSGQLPAVKFGGRYRIREQDLWAYLHEHGINLDDNPEDSEEKHAAEA